ncbi:ribosome assembly RNA-binding protein YhbY [Nitrosococcus wardiae]|uniref:Ribosome assembly RNA-binding protein YhbY n=1 Tax=Nitrosococcus wardiae TaxID=1814290 RepID=A0A4P7C1B2_9GAMM|nr:ribosome assembly RNA-binding protein YhbY [Nitrosococcus wardiae]QBQ55439.1 ribosome assembly RNA-binding protein YhbY [Nitrosococcus wardiae]
MPLTKNQVRYLRALAHSLKPVVIIGQNGVTEAVLEEINNALEHHELIKIKIHGAEREERSAMIKYILEVTEAELVQIIGRTGVFYRRGEKARLALP